MPKKKNTKICKNCAYLYTDRGHQEACWFSGKTNNPQKKACSKFKLGRSLVPRIGGRLSKLVSFDSNTTISWTFYTSESECMILTWDPSDQCFRIQLVGIKNEGGIRTKQFSSEKELALFCGRIEVMGVDENSLYTSVNHTDRDVIDEDGKVIDKPVEVRIIPSKPTKA